LQRVGFFDLNVALRSAPASFPNGDAKDNQANSDQRDRDRDGELSVKNDTD
jgi:hypothetical protein